MMRVLEWVVMMFAASTARSADIDALFAAERAFAASSPELGVKTAFLDVLADDALLFRPGPVNGREWYAARPDAAPFTLEWAPAAGEVSADLGYTYGPYRLTPRDAAGKPGDPLGGHFFSVWARDGDGRWRLQLDSGIQHALMAFPSEAVARGNPQLASTAGGDTELIAADARLNVLRAQAHEVAALQRFASADAVELRSGQPPQAFSALNASAPMRAQPTRVYLRISSNGVLAATAGSTIGDKPQNYQRAWRHGADGWKVVVDLVGD